jgi:type I restriction enzyme S subunit
VSAATSNHPFKNQQPVRRSLGEVGSSIVNRTAWNASHPMTLDTFFKKFDQFADAPNAVAKMRELVLELAVQGKLVSQDPNDKPASAILKKIDESRRQLPRGAIRKKLEQIPAIDSEELPFMLPKGWEWCRLGSLGSIGSSCRVHQKDWTSSGVPFLRAREIVKLAKFGQVDNELFISEELFQELSKDGLTPEKDDLMITGVGTIGIPYIVKNTDRFYFKDASVLIFKNLFRQYPLYLHAVLQSPYGIKEIHRDSMGTTVHTLTIIRANLIPIPLPPLAEQKRIVAKLDELMALCDRLEAQQKERDEQASALARASLARFSEAPTPANLNLLFHKSYSISPADLRKTILTQAVKGMLVAKSGRWSEEKLKDVAHEIVDCPHSTPKWTSNGKVCVRTSQFRPGLLDLSVTRYVSEPTYRERIQRLKPQADDILYSREGGILGVACRVPQNTELCLGQRMMLVRAGKSITPAFLELVLNSPLITDIARRETTGGAAPRVNVSTVKSYPIPVPPLAEQRQIVSKVDQLMALVDQLETQLVASRAAAKHLLEALVAELTKIK